MATISSPLARNVFSAAFTSDSFIAISPAIWESDGVPANAAQEFKPMRAFVLIDGAETVALAANNLVETRRVKFEPGSAGGFCRRRSAFADQVQCWTRRACEGLRLIRDRDRAARTLPD